MHSATGPQPAMPTNRAFTVESLPQNLRELQAQLNSAIRAHRNLVGRVNLCPNDRSLIARAQAAERLIGRIHKEQKPLLERFKRDCRLLAARSAEAKKNFRVGAKIAATIDELLEDRVRHHFCPSTLEKWTGSTACLSPEKKRKVNFLACFDLIAPRVRDDVVDAKSSPRRRKQLVNPDFPLVSSTTSATATTASTAVAAATPVTATISAKPQLQQQQQPAPSAGHSNGLVATGNGAGILTRSSRRACRFEEKPSFSLLQQQQQQQQQQKRKPQFCCAKCHQLMPNRPVRAPLSSVATIGQAASAAPASSWCPTCIASCAATADIAIGLPCCPPSTPASSGSGNQSTGSTTSDKSPKQDPNESFEFILPLGRIRRSEKNLRLESLLSKLSRNNSHNSDNNKDGVSRINGQ
ncbi:hypothetical protein BOX15_Mlig028440g1 [Macrostomum lignano]|uniref:Uncharacterized protein n=1 Tax=Macrostomum lignano TaxID=282301 RepID=A0A267FCJ5_9PLAT|nr:hypothetical protein BOX15_Mlig028440g1 [Macrostomum lignano]